MAKANTKNEKFNGKIAGLTALQVIFYLLSIPVIVVLAVVFGIQTYQLVPYYSFWPFVGTILAGVLCLVFMIVVMCITLRKKSKRTVLMQTVSIVIAAVMLTSFIAVMLDIVLPDVLAQLTSSTLFYDDLENADQAEEQAVFNSALDRKFILLNLLNGNYDPQYDYDALKETPAVSDRARQLNRGNSELRTADTTADYEKYFFDSKELVAGVNLYRELFDFVYGEYIMTDIDYCLLNPDKEFGNTTRLAMGHAISEYLYPVFKQLSEEGMSNERISYLFTNNYASLKNDGYLTYDDSMILYATTGRMTVPVVIRLILDNNYTYTEGQGAYIENDQVVEPEGTYFLELYKPDEVLAIMEADADSPKGSVVEWNSDETRGVLKTDMAGYTAGAVIIPSYDAEGNLIGGYIRAPRVWSILDMDGKNMDVAAISDVVIDLGSLLGGLLDGVDLGEYQGLVDQIMGMILKPMTLGELLQTGGILDSVLGLASTAFGLDASVSYIVSALLNAIPEVVAEATGGAALYLRLAINDEGALQISIAPTNVEAGMHGYQYMTWMESNSLLIAVISVMSLREWLYIFGAVSVLMAFAAGMCREIVSRIKRDIADNEEKEAREKEEEEARRRAQSAFGDEEDEASANPADESADYEGTPPDAGEEPAFDVGE